MDILTAAIELSEAKQARRKAVGIEACRASIRVTKADLALAEAIESARGHHLEIIEWHAPTEPPPELALVLLHIDETDLSPREVVPASFDGRFWWAPEGVPVNAPVLGWAVLPKGIATTA